MWTITLAADTMNNMNNIVTLNNVVGKAGGIAYITGGTARDLIMGRQPKDIDVEVYGISVQALPSVLSTLGKTELVGMSFPVWKVRIGDETMDVALPRRERQVADTHTGFEVEADPFMTVQEAVMRRDFTVGGIMVNITTGEVIDLVGGVDDAHSGLLRPIGPRFAEDPLRVLRGMQFASRFNMTATSEMIEMGRQLVGRYGSISHDRIWVEWEKWAAGDFLVAGLEFLAQVGWEENYPEIAAMRTVAHSVNSHHYGETVYEHTVQVVGRMPRSGLSRAEKVETALAALCHDMGKVVTSNGQGGFAGHEIEDRAERFLVSIGCPIDVMERVLTLVREHMVASGGQLSQSAVRRLAHRMGNVPVRELAWLMGADGFVTEASALVETANEVNVVDHQPQPLVRGRDLVAQGMNPGPQMGWVLRRLFEAQLDGAFDTVDEGVAYWVANIR